MPNIPARDSGYQLDHYLRKTVTYLDSGTAVEIGTMPAGSVVVGSHLATSTAFNAGSTNTISIGYATDSLGTANAAAYGTALAAGTTGLVTGSQAVASAIPRAVDTTVTATYSQTGTAASAGTTEVIVRYIPNR